MTNERKSGWVRFFRQIEQREASGACEDESVGVSLSDALSFSSELSDDIIPPNLSIAEDGEVIVHWMGEGHYVEVDFFEAGYFEFYAHDKECNRQIEGVRKKVENGVPDGLKELLDNVSNRAIVD